jgi:hypothetical protein
MLKTLISYLFMNLEGLTDELLNQVGLTETQMRESVMSYIVTRPRCNPYGGSSQIIINTFKGIHSCENQDRSLALRIYGRV